MPFAEGNVARGCRIGIFLYGKAGQRKVRRGMKHIAGGAPRGAERPLRNSPHTSGKGTKVAVFSLRTCNKINEEALEKMYIYEKD